MIASTDFTSSGLGAGTLAARSAGVITGADGGISIGFTASAFCARAIVPNAMQNSNEENKRLTRPPSVALSVKIRANPWQRFSHSASLVILSRTPTQAKVTNSDDP